MRILTHERIAELHTAVVDANLAMSRDALLAGVDRSFYANLRIEKALGAQILSDLEALNEAGWMSDGSTLLACWLRNAVSLTGYGGTGAPADGEPPQSNVFARALDDVIHMAADVPGALRVLPTGTEPPPGQPSAYRSDAVGPTPLRIEVRAPGGRTFGAGWLLAGDPSRIVTAFHVVGCSRTGEWEQDRRAGVELLAFGPGGVPAMKLRRIAHDLSADLAVLEIVPGQPVSLGAIRAGALAATPVAPRSSWSVSAPSSAGPGWVHVTGGIQGSRGEPSLFLEPREPVERPGALSGAAIVDRSGAVIGVFTTGFEDGPPEVASIAYGGSAAALAKLVQRAPPRVRPGIFAGGLQLLAWLFIAPERWTAHLASGRPLTLTPDVSLCQLPQRARVEDPALDRLLAQCVAGPACALLVAAAVPALLWPLPEASFEHWLLVRHVILTTTLSVSLGLGLSVGGTIASGMIAASVGTIVGAVVIPLDQIFRDYHANFGIGVAVGAGFGAIAVISPAIHPAPVGREARLSAARAVVPTLMAGTFVAMLCYGGFELSQEIGRWFTHRSLGPLIAVGAALGAGLGALISLPGWVRLRLAPDAQRRLAPLVTWIGLPLFAGAFLTCVMSGPVTKETLPVGGLALGALAGAVLAGAFAVVHLVLMLIIGERRSPAVSALGTCAIAAVVFAVLKVFKYVPGPILTAEGFLGGFLAAAALVALLHVRARKDAAKAG